MPLAKLSSKGQVTIPKPVRDALGVRTGDQLDFFVREDGVVELRARTRSLLDLAGFLGERRYNVTLEEMNEAIAEGAIASAMGNIE